MFLDRYGFLFFETGRGFADNVEFKYGNWWVRGKVLSERPENFPACFRRSDYGDSHSAQTMFPLSDLNPLIQCLQEKEEEIINLRKNGRLC